MINLQKRQKIMARSIKLGHCICNPKQACPCDTLRQRDICPCAGERPEQAIENVELTKLVEKAGCASKINQNDLKAVLAGLPAVIDPNVLVGSNTCDDAGVYRISDSLALVQTVDVFSPCVDDPYTFGQIAAANSLSDVYAMGGKPLTALSVIGFPIESVSPRVMTQMLRGGQDKMREAGVAVIGGHSINDKEPKFGYAVTGIIDPSKIITNARAKPGDALILTKPLGVGVISFAAQMGMASPEALAAASRSMTELNAIAAEAMTEIGVSAATDVTGFGLMGHLGEMVTQSGVTAEVWFDGIPILDGVIDCISRGVISGGVERNLEHSSQLVTRYDDITDEMATVLYDPQTSGGLLISVPEDKADQLLSRLVDSGIAHASIIGRIAERSTGQIIVSQNVKNKLIGASNRMESQETTMDHQDTADRQDTATDRADTGCCCCGDAPADHDGAPHLSGTDNDGAPPHFRRGLGGGLPGLTDGNSAAETQKRFAAFMGSANADSAVPERTKELIAIALSLLSKCEPCVKIHIDAARELGISEEEITEAIWLAISFGGAPTMMFYKNLCENA